MKDMRVMALLLISVVIGGSGCARRFEVDSESAKYDGQVFLLRGLFNWWSTGMDEVGEKLQAAGAQAEVLPGPEWLVLGQRIVKSPPQGPLVLVGHSYGADDAIRLARYLEDRGQLVNALVLIDPTTPPVVPGNVLRCFNLYKSNPDTDWMPWFRGIPVEVESSGTRLVNYDLRKLDRDGKYKDLDHFKIDNNPEVQDVVVREVVRSLKRRW